jgi:hypothetical protein
MPTSVEDICKLYIHDASKVANCNEFLQAVAAKVGSEYGIDLRQAFSGNADSIRARLGGEKPFISIGRMPALATQLANQGQFVIGGLSHAEMTYVGRDKKEHAATMGHVVVIAPGGPSHATTITLANGKKQPCRGGYPYCYQGAAHEMYRILGRTQVDLVFPALLLGQVCYAYIDILKKP